MILSEGILSFSLPIVTKKQEFQSSWKKTAIILLKDDTEEYYSWFLNKRFNLKLNKTLRGSHVTIINDKIFDYDKYNEILKLYEGKIIKFEFDLNCKSDGKHWWMNVSCLEALTIRKECGLDEKPYFGFHLTIGHANEKNIEHSNYILKTCIRFNF